MQLIVEFSVEAEEYKARNLQRSVSAPPSCPHCQRSATLEALGYYQRNLTGRRSAVLRLAIRRFCCKACGKTVSILPSFAQPYRLIHNRTIHRFFCGQRRNEDVQPWLGLLRPYWKRFAWWISQDGCVVHRQLDPASPPRAPAAWWAKIVAAFGNMAAATQVLVTESQVTLFGKYRCHRPNISQS